MASGSGSKKKRPPKRRFKKRKIALLVVEILVLVVAIVALVIVIKTTNKKTGIKNFELNSEDISVNTGVKEVYETNEKLANHTEIALFGVDNRDKKADSTALSKSSRTDTIMICSINEDTKEIKLASVYRDTYLNVGNDTYNKCNSAYAMGGYEQAINMLNMNLDLNITSFITVGFQGVISAVDAVGGVDINVTDAEIPHLNNYQASIYATEEDPHKLITDYTPVTQPGMQTLNGQQALAYCRIRYIGNDFQRTERQRAVLQQILLKAQKLNPTQLNSLTTEVFPLVATNLHFEDIVARVSAIGDYKIVDTTGFPFDDGLTTGMIGSKGSCVVPIDLESNVIELHKFLYPEVEYTPSADVQAYSEKIHSDTKSYVGR